MADLERYVATTGEDKAGNGTAANPFRTIQKAAADLKASLAAGQAGKILVEPGVYEEVVVLTTGMQLLRKDETDGVTVDTAQEFYIEKGPAVIIRRPRPASGDAKSSSTPTWTEVIKVNGKNILIRGVIIDGDSRPQRALFIHDSENVTVMGSLIKGSYSKILYTGKETGTEADPFHSDPTDAAEGAGLRIFRSHKVTIKSCAFIDNKTELKYKQALTDAEISALEDTWTYKAADLRGNISADQKKKLRQPIPVRDGGGHVSCFDADEILFDTCHFEDGFAGGRGGAIQFAHNAYGQCLSCLFLGNESGVDGGAVCFSDPDPDFFSRKPISFTGCKFLNNRSGDDGGAVYLTTKAQASFKSCIFDSNWSKSNGGALRATFGASVFLENCELKGNRGNYDAAVKLEMNQDGGGAIAVNNSSLEMKGGKIERNFVDGFAGGGIYFITAAYDENAEKVAELTHGHTFEDILKNGYGVTSVQLKLTGVTFEGNVASGETCNSAYCTPAPLKTGFASRCAGGAVYVLESIETMDLPPPTDKVPKLKLPVTVLLENVQITKNLATHKEDQQKADLVIRHVTKLIMKSTTIVADPLNRYAASFIDVQDGDLSGSPDLALHKAKSEIWEKGSTLKY